MTVSIVNLPFKIGAFMRILLDNPNGFFKKYRETFWESFAYMATVVGIFAVLNEMSIRAGLTNYVPKAGIAESLLVNFMGLVGGFFLLALIFSSVALKKYGFRREDGFLQTYNFGAEYYLNTLFDDEVKRSNKKTYQEMMFELAEIEASKDNFIINLGKFSNFGKIFVKKNNIEGKKIIGIHMGASLRWPSKIWHEDRLFEFVKKAKAKSYEIIIFGGPEEEEKQKEFVEKLDNVGVRVYRNNPKNSDLEFSSLVNVCDVMICSDSFSLHVSIALGKPTVGLFFCTPPNEVEDYGILRKIVSSRLYEFFPERMDEYDEELVKSINENDVLSLINEIFREKNL